MRTNESGPASDKYSQEILEITSELYNDSAAANIGKQVSTVNDWSRWKRISVDRIKQID
jgi:hypothetical protein